VTAPWEAWSPLAGDDWGHAFEVRGAERLGDDEPVLAEEDGVYVWALESVWRTHTGLYLFTRVERRGGADERRLVILGATPDELVTAVRGQLGMTPGRIEVLGRAGIEIGLEPDDEIEGDELEGPIPD
jgi:hypothetical protein